MKSENHDQISELYRSHEEASDLPDTVDRRAFLMRTAMVGTVTVLNGCSPSSNEEQVGYLCKHNATLSGAEGGCQAEIGAVKPWTGFMIASNEVPTNRRVDFDTTVAAMALTAKEMNAKYNETSEGGLAVSVVLC